MANKYEITEDKKNQYQSIVILNEMINNKGYFSINMEGNDAMLEPLFIKMQAKGLIGVDNYNYIPLDKGREALQKFFEKYYEYLKVYDLYCAVDLGQGEFGFSEIFDREEDDFLQYIQENRFEDLRIAVTEFKKLNPTEMIFQSFINENRFDLEKDGWQFDLMEDLLWNEMVEICENAIHPEDIPDEIEVMIQEGSELMKTLFAKEKEIQEAEDKEVEDDIQDDNVDDGYDEPVTYVEEVVMVEYGYDHFDPYYNDPYYVNPIWYYDVW